MIALCGALTTGDVGDSHVLVWFRRGTLEILGTIYPRRGELR